MRNQSIHFDSIDKVVRHAGNRKVASISSGTHPCGEDNGILDSSQRRDLPQGKDFGQPFRVITAVSERRLIPFTKHYMLMDTS